MWSDGTYNYVWGMELITNGSVYYLYNAHGDVVQLVNASGTVTKTYDYEAYGNELTRDAADPNPFRYCGEYYDNETGFIYLRARYYDPSVGRFISQDPAKDGLNWYIYANDNPISYADPSGLSTERNGITWYDSADKAAYAFGVKYNSDSIRRDKEIGTCIYSQAFYWYDGKYYSSIEMGRAYDGTESLRDFYKKFTRVRMYYYDDVVIYGGSYKEGDYTYKYVNIIPMRGMGRLEAMVHTHGDFSNGGESEFSMAKIDQNGQFKEYNDSGVAYMYRTYGFNAFTDKNPNEKHGIKDFVLYLVTPDGDLKKLITETKSSFVSLHISNPFDNPYYTIPRCRR